MTQEAIEKLQSAPSMIEHTPQPEQAEPERRQNPAKVGIEVSPVEPVETAFQCAVREPEQNGGWVMREPKITRRFPKGPSLEKLARRMKMTAEDFAKRNQNRD